MDIQTTQLEDQFQRAFFKLLVFQCLSQHVLVLSEGAILNVSFSTCTKACLSKKNCQNKGG